jgi:hypothetical protein
LEVINKQRVCKGFIKYESGKGPEEHQDMLAQREAQASAHIEQDKARLWQSSEAEKQRKWQEEQNEKQWAWQEQRNREEDAKDEKQRQWQEAENEKNRAWQEKQTRSEKRWRLVLMILGPLLGAAITIGIGAASRQGWIKISDPPKNEKQSEQ